MCDYGCACRQHGYAMQSTPPIRKDASARARITKNVRSKQAELDKLVSWLTDHGVGKRNARRFLIKCVCDLPAAAVRASEGSRSPHSRGASLKIL